MESCKYNVDCFLFTIDFKTLYTLIPNAHLIIDLLGLVLQNSLMSFDKEYVQQFFGIIMGTNVAPILGTELRKKCKSDPKLKWPVLLKRFIDHGFGIFYGSREDIAYWIKQFNMLRESIKIDKWTIGNFKGWKFFSCGKMDIKLHQKK